MLNGRRMFPRRFDGSKELSPGPATDEGGLKNKKDDH